MTYWLSIFMGHLWQLNDFKDHTFMRELSVTVLMARYCEKLGRVDKAA